MRGVTTSYGSVIARGNTSEVYAIGVDAIVKVPRPDVPPHWIDIEATHAAAVHAVGLPTPMVLDLIEVDGRRSIVFERIDGPSMADRLISHPNEAEALAHAMADIQAEFHRAAAPAELPDLRGRVAGKIQAVAQLSAEERGAAGALLDTLDGGTSICHGDIHPGNILIGDRGLYVIDWFDAAAGTPVADVVRSSLLTRPLGSPPAPPSHLAGVPAALLDDFHHAYVERMLPILADDARSTLAWEVVRSVSRLSEPQSEGASDLLSIWRRRCDQSLSPDTPLAEILAAG